MTSLTWFPALHNIIAGKCKDLNFPCTPLQMSQLLVAVSGLVVSMIPHKSRGQARAFRSRGCGGTGCRSCSRPGSCISAAHRISSWGCGDRWGLSGPPLLKQGHQTQPTTRNPEQTKPASTRVPRRPEGSGVKPPMSSSQGSARPSCTNPGADLNRSWKLER